MSCGAHHLRRPVSSASADGGTCRRARSAQSAKEYEEWERHLKLVINAANGVDDEEDAAEDAQTFAIEVRAACDPTAEPFAMEGQALRGEETTTRDVVEAFLATKSAAWRAEHGAEVGRTTVHRRAYCEVLMHDDMLADYDFVRLQLTTSETPRVELTLSFVEDGHTDPGARAESAGVDQAELDFRMDELAWLRPGGGAGAAQATATAEDLDGHLAMIIDRLRRDPLLDVEAEAKGEVWSKSTEFSTFPQM